MADSVFEPEISTSLKYFREYGNSYMKFVPIAIECKKVSSSARLSFDKVRDHQIKGLLRFQKEAYYNKMTVASHLGKGGGRFKGKTDFDYMFVSKGIGYLVVNFRFTKKAPRKDVEKGVNRVFAVTVDEYLEIKEELLKEGVKSIDYWWFVDNAIELPRIRIDPPQLKDKKYCWDISPLLEY